MAKNILRLLLAVAVLGSTTLAVALPPTVATPRDQKNNQADPGYAGYSATRVASATETVICTGRCLLRAIIMGTAPASSYVTIRNSSVADGSGAQVLPVARFSVSNSTPGNNPVVAPVLLSKGITATLSSASSGEEITVLYLDTD